jgi:hypoxanthine phosphoribosyltransferase
VFSSCNWWQFACIYRTYSDAFGVIGFVAGVFGVGFAIFTNRQSQQINQLNKKLELQLKTIGFEDIKNFSHFIIARLGNWQPDVIYAPDLRGAFVAYMLSQEMRRSIPVLHGVIVAKSAVPLASLKSDYNPDHRYIEFSTKRYHVLMDNQLAKYSHKKVLIVDEIVITGEVMERLRQELLAKGFAAENLKTCSIVACSVAAKNDQAPDLYWRQVENADIVFPWGTWD